MGIEDNQWYRPVLYLRWEDNQGGQLFNSQNLVGRKLENPNHPSQQRQKLRLQQELADLIEEQDACKNQYRSTIDEAQRIRLNRKLDDLDKQINSLENQINDI